jgi:hypothetical protein
VPYGLTVDGSADRAAYARHLQGYLAATLRPLFAAWDGELPAHLQKARRPAGPRRTLSPSRGAQREERALCARPGRAGRSRGLERALSRALHGVAR